ncbi:MAG: bifunctional proline dehydrogenase/L-glutamate gamma-semialdehyde dehydrogenase [Actinomycetota bacterium]|nr:bifunctional proline dehydrogenase/L-glutamate gamma-semialdehyde dehydrogenase [Actinomycetota bacterium]
MTTPPSVDRGDDLTNRAVDLAERLLSEAADAERWRDRQRHRRLAGMLDDPDGKLTMLALIDEVMRIRDPQRATAHLRALVERRGAPDFLGPIDRLAFTAGARIGPRAPGPVLRLVEERLRLEAGGSVLPAEDPAFARHVQRRHDEGISLNINVLGEAVLGNDEAARRVEQVIARLRRPDLDYVSVKISAICAQLSTLAFDASVHRIAEPLRRLYRVAQEHSPAKFVNLDMEEYGDLELTTAVFRSVLDEPELTGLDAGIVLQAYLPDSSAALEELCEWARDRHARGGGRIKIRVVKGANLAMEQVEAELRGWPQAPYTTKAEVDAHYKRLVETALDDRYADSVRLGVASHNLFDVAWALLVARERNATDRVEIEMLEGMAPAQARATKTEAGGILLYAPIVAREDFESAIAYLVRRLDENTGPDNFLRSLFSMEPGSATLAAERERFLAAVERRQHVDTRPRRIQDRTQPAAPISPDAPCANEPDTDVTLAVNRAWVADALDSFTSRPPRDLAATIDGEDVAEPLTGVSVAPNAVTIDGADPDAPGAYRYVEATGEMVERAVAAARKPTAGPRWAARPRSERRAILCRVADAMVAHRGEAVATMVHDGGKTVAQADPEVSEAIDFARYYAASTRLLDEIEHEGTRFEPLGTVVVASPWNFPFAIPAGGVLAALAAGNAVILKPAPETVATARLVARCCWEAGVPRDVLQFVPCPEDEVGQRLITHPDVDGVILTGAYDTARLFTSWRPDLRLHAETSGKNALVITAAADLDEAIADLVSSAFGNTGQKCSAASLAIVEASVYDDPSFRRRVADTVRTLAVGPSTDLATDVGPLVSPPAGPLRQALENLDDGEEWLVAPAMVGDNPHLWSPGVKLGVRPGSTFHHTECFGPVLGLMRAESLDEAIDWQNDTGFGLTGGICSLDDAEVDHWAGRVEVGNAYVNRHITGAIVQRQPFGGWKRSSVGATVKAGGPNYVASLGHWTTTDAVSPQELATSLDRWWARELGREHDPSGLAAERNVFRYRALPLVVLRVGPGVSAIDVTMALAAAERAGTPVEVTTGASGAELEDLLGDRGLVIESDDVLAERLASSGAARLRALGPLDGAVRLAAIDAGIAVDDRDVVGHGLIEGVRWVREQALSITNHRHGTILTP